MNSVNFVGRLTKDAEVRCTTSGKNVATFGLAVDRPFTYGDKKQVDFFNIVWWIKSDKMSDYLIKGKEVAITGYIQNRSYEAKDGSKKYITEVIVENLSLVGGKPSLVESGKEVESESVPF